MAEKAAANRVSYQSALVRSKAFCDSNDQCFLRRFLKDRNDLTNFSQYNRNLISCYHHISLKPCFMTISVFR